MALPLYLHSGRPSIPRTKGFFYLRTTVHHFKLKWQLENVEQLVQSWEKMFYINICTYKLAEGHERCTRGQNLSCSLQPSWGGGGKRGAANFPKWSLHTQLRKSKEWSGTQKGGTQKGALQDTGTKFTERYQVHRGIIGKGQAECEGMWPSAEKSLHQLSSLGSILTPHPQAPLQLQKVSIPSRVE